MKNSREIPLEHGGYYHIYNRGNNGEKLFYTPENNYHFLRLYEKYIDPIADTYAWCLMGNHFHFLIRVKNEKEIGHLPAFNASGSADAERLSKEDKWKLVHDLPESEGSGSVSKSISDLNASGFGNSGRFKWETTNILPESTVPVSDFGFTESGNFIKSKKPVPHRMFGHLFNAYTKYLNRKVGRTGSLFEKNFHRIPIESDKYFQNLVVYIHHNPVHHGFTDDFRDYPWSSYGSILSEKKTRLKRQVVVDWFDGVENLIKTHEMCIENDSIAHLVVD